MKLKLQRSKIRQKLWVINESINKLDVMKMKSLFSCKAINVEKKKEKPKKGEYSHKINSGKYL